MSKPVSYKKIHHCKDCEFMWALGACVNVCTIDMVEKLPRHPHDAINFKTMEKIHEYDSVVRTNLNDDNIVDVYNGTCNFIVVR